MVHSRWNGNNRKESLGNQFDGIRNGCVMPGIINGFLPVHPANTTIQTPEEFRRTAENEFLKTFGYDDKDIAALSPESARTICARSNRPAAV
jgi:hypothetical protein